MSGILEEFFGGAASQPQPTFNKWLDDFGLPENPFPPNRRIVPEVLYNQEQAFGQFKAVTRELMEAPGPQRRALALVAGTGGGKTHFLRHCQYKFHELSKALKRPFAVVEHTAGALKVLELLREIYRQGDAASRKHWGTDLLTALARALELPEGDAALAALPLGDVKQSLKQLREALRTGQNYDASRELCWRWLQAETLTTTEKKRLGVSSRIASATVAVRVLGQIFGIAKRLKVLEGVLLCLDEVEAIFSMGASFAQVQAFLHELRFLYDDIAREGDGYSLLLVSASTDTGRDRLRQVNYAVFQRFGFEAPVELQRIQGVSQAIDFTHHYIDYFHGRWQSSHPGERPRREPRSLLPNDSIEAAFREASVKGASEAPQGPLLDALHRKVEERQRQWEDAQKA